MKKTSKKGFTLIELMIVMAIIAILAVLGIAAINSARKTARDTQRRANAKSIQTGLEAYYATYKAYPKNGTSGSPDLTTANKVGYLFTSSFAGSSSNLGTFITGELKDGDDDLKLTTDSLGRNRYSYKWTSAGYEIRVAMEATGAINAVDSGAEVFKME